MELLSIGLPAQPANSSYSVHRQQHPFISASSLYQHDSSLYIDDISMTEEAEGSEPIDEEPKDEEPRTRLTDEYG